MTMVKNMSGPKPYHNNLVMVVMLLQNRCFVNTFHLDSYSWLDPRKVTASLYFTKNKGCLGKHSLF